MRRNIYPMTDTITWAASTKNGVDVPEEGYITHIDTFFTLNITGGSTVVAVQDGWARTLTAATLKASGAKTYFDITDGRQWLYWMHHIYRSRIDLTDLPTAGASAANYYMVLPIHWGLNPYDKFDRTVVVPAVELTNLRMDVTWGAATGLIDSDSTVGSGNAKLVVYELVLEKGDLVPEVWPRGLLSPRMEADVEASISSTYSNFSFKKDMPVGDTLYQTLLLVLDSSGNRSRSYLSEYRLEFPKARMFPIEHTWRTQEFITYRDFDLDARLTGALLFPWGEVTGDVAGLDLSAAMKGDVKLGFTIATASGALHLLHYALG